MRTVQKSPNDRQVDTILMGNFVEREARWMEEPRNAKVERY